MLNKKKLKLTVSTVIIALCTLLYILVYLLPFTGGTTENAILFGAFYRPMILAGEWWRLLTMGLIHGSFMHLFVNMYSLFNLSIMLERVYGGARFTLILILSSLFGGLFLLAGSRTIVAVGLSGGLYGLMGALVVWLSFHGALRDPYVRNNLLRILLINLMINFLPNIGVMAHFGGFAAGCLIGTALCKDGPDQAMKRNCAAAAVLLFAVLCIKIIRYPVRTDEVYLGTDISILSFYRDHGLSSYAGYMAKKLDAVYDIEYLESIY